MTTRCTLVLLLMVVPCRTTAQSRDALHDIVGVWQSDTTGGVSARSTCATSPQGDAVICEQRITSSAGVRHTVNFFMVDTTAHRYVYYGVNQPGSTVEPVPLAIADHIWIYGGHTRESDGMYYRTVNDFTAGNSYEWRQERSQDGVHWTVLRHGRSVRSGKSAALPGPGKVG